MQHGHRGVREEESVCEKGRERGAARERERERKRETMSYPNEHVVAKTLSSCSPSEANEHVDSVRRSRRTSPRMRCVIHTVKVKQSRTITAETGASACAGAAMLPNRRQ